MENVKISLTYNDFSDTFESIWTLGDNEVVHGFGGDDFMCINRASGEVKLVTTSLSAGLRWLVEQI